MPYIKIMKTEFEINDILNAVNTIYKVEKKEKDFLKSQKNYTKNDDILMLNNEVKSNKIDILVLNQMIE